jgi:signal transduction histidine kinase/ligand-binding sensor domain-containing protein/DNA-binding response OmpR family regulator
MKPVSMLSLVAIFLVLSWSGTAQEMSFEHLSTDDGLSQNMIYEIVQDQTGFLWIATKDGLNRYDGYTFRQFRHNPFDSTSIAEGEITSLFLDRKGKLWSGSKGLSLYNSSTGSFQRYLSDAGNTNINLDETISTIYEMPAQNRNEFYLWLGISSAGLFRVLFSEALPGGDVSPVLKEIVRVTHGPGVAHGLTNSDIRDIKSDKQNNLWIATSSGLFLHLPECTIHQTNSPNLCFRHYDLETDDAQGLMNSYISALGTDSEGNLIVGTRDGVSRLLYGDDHITFEHYPYPPELTQFPWPRTINSLLIFDESTIWLGMTSALGILDLESQTYRFIHNDPYDPTGLSFDNIQTIHRDRGNIVWLGTAGKGLSKYNPKKKDFNAYIGGIDREPYRTTLSVQTLFVLFDDNGTEREIWFSSGDVLYIRDQHTGEVRKFEPNIYIPFEYYGIIQDRSGMLWIATHVGIYMYDPANRSLRHLPVKPTLSDVQVEDRVFSMYIDNGGTLWAATLEHISRYDPSTQSFHHYLLQWGNGQTVSNVMIHSIYQDERQGSTTLWLGGNKGLARFDTESGSLTPFQIKPRHPEGLNIRYINCIAGDPSEPDRFLWIGTRGGGLYRYDIRQDIFKQYTTDHGLPNNVIYGILSDGDGNLWLSTNNGLSKFHTRTEMFKNFDVKDGLQSNEFNTGAHHKARNGKLLFGGINGFNEFFPDRITDNPHIPPVVLTDFRINYKPVPIKSDGSSPLLSAITEMDEIRLSYNENILSFEITALDFSIPLKNLYAHKLENFDSEWIYAGSERRVNYSNLPPGKYVFRARASNNDGIWNEEGTATSIIILPPPWRTWWAYSAYILVGIFALYTLHRYELNRIKLRNRLQIERIEAEKLREIDNAKSRFFANISHEFRTPLTLILGSLERLKNRRRNDGGETYHALIERNARRLLELISQILDIARLEAGHVKLQYVYSDLKGFVRRLTISFLSFTEQKGIYLTFISDDSPVDTHFDPDKIEKVFSNLISNAIKYTPPGGYIRISAAVSKNGRDETSYAEFKVENSGSGIPKEHIQKIFDRFYQIPAVAGNGEITTGTGIGLSMVKELVELHRGTISVESIENIKTTFTVRLPIDTVDSGTRKEILSLSLPVLEEIGPGFDGNGSGKMRSDNRITDAPIVLTVEDNNEVRRLISETLKEEYRIIEARNGVEGCKIALETVPDLIICDVIMPEMDGFELCEKIKSDERTSHIPIVILTAKAGMKSKITGLEFGADDYIIKPFNGEEILVRVKNLIQQRKKLQEFYSKTESIQERTRVPVSAEDKFLARLTDIVEQHISDENFDVLTFSRKAGLSHSQLHRKLTALTGKSASQFVRSYRLSRAAELIRNNAGNLAEITYQVGFSSQAYFSRCFSREFGCSPSEYKRKIEPEKS